VSVFAGIFKGRAALAAVDLPPICLKRPALHDDVQPTAMVAFSSIAAGWAGSFPIVVVRFWQRRLGVGEWETISGSEGLIYTPSTSDVGYALRKGETASNAHGVATEYSEESAPVLPAGAGEEPAVPEMTAPPVASAAALAIGSLVSLDDLGEYDPPATSFEYQWMRGAAEIADASGLIEAGDPLPSYLTTAADDAALVRCRITPINADGAGDSAYSNYVGPFAAEKVWYHRWNFSSSAAAPAAPFDLFHQAIYTANVPVVGSSGLRLHLTGASTWQLDNTPTAPWFVGSVSMYGATRRFVLEAPEGRPTRLRFAARNTHATLTRVLQIWDGDPGVDAGAVMLATVTLPIGALAVAADGVEYGESAAWESLTEDAYVDLPAAARGNYTLRIGDATATPVIFYHLTLENPTNARVLSGVGSFHVSPDGNDVTGDGSLAAPWKHAPGTPGAGGLVPEFVPLPGSRILFQRGRVHRPPSVAADQIAMLALSNGGTAEAAITIGSYGAGATPEIRGTVPLSTGWSAPAGGSKAALSVQGAAGKVRRRAVSNLHRAQHPVHGNQKLYAARWPYGPTLSLCDNDDRAVGWYRRNVTVINSGTTQDADTGQPNTSTFVDPLLIERGTGEAASLVGYQIIYAAVGNVLAEATILFHDRASGTLKFVYASGATPYTVTTPGASGESCYQVAWCPFDLRYEYQYALDNPLAPTELFVSLPEGADLGVLELAALSQGLAIEANYIETDDDALSFRHLALNNAAQASTKPNSSIAIYNGGPRVGVKIGTFKCRDFSSVASLGSRRNVIGGDSKLQLSEVRGIEVYDCPTASVIRTGQESGFVSIASLKASNIGRTGLLIRGRNNEFYATGLEFNNINNRHGNAVSRYESGPLVGVVEGLSARNCQRSFTHYGADGYDSSLTIRYFFLTPALADETSEPIAYSGIIDYNGYSPGLVFEYGLAVGCGNARGGYSFAEYIGQPGPGRPATPNIRRGMVVEGLLIGSGTTDLSMWTFENVLITKTTANVSSADDLRALGANIVNDSVVFVDQLWNGTITREMWEMLTRDGQTGNHVLRPLPGHGILPAFGAMLDRAALTCRLNTLDRIPARWPAGYTVGSITGYLPCTSLSLDPADGDNAELGARLVKGDLQFTVVGPTAPKSLVVTLTPLAGAGYGWTSIEPKKVAILLPVSGL
jgi:hypothetical protein